MCVFWVAQEIPPRGKYKCAREHSHLFLCKIGHMFQLINNWETTSGKRDTPLFSPISSLPPSFLSNHCSMHTNGSKMSDRSGGTHLKVVPELSRDFEWLTIGEKCIIQLSRFESESNIIDTFFPPFAFKSGINFFNVLQEKKRQQPGYSHEMKSGDQ